MRSLTGFAAALLALAGFARIAAASPMLQLSISQSGFGTVSVTTTPGNTVSFIGNYGSYTNTSHSGVQISGYGDATGFSFTVQISKTRSAYPALTISMTETDLPAIPGTVIDFTSYTSATLHTASKLTLNTYYDLTDAVYGTQHLINSRTLTGPLSTGGNVTELATLISAPYSITKVATLTPTAGAFPTYGPQLYVTVPEPASLALLAPALPLMIALRPRRRKAA